MSLILDKEFMLEVAKGNVPGHSLVHKFGRNSAVGTTLVPVSSGAVYQTPTAAASLEIVSSSSADSAAGAGARSVYIEGLDANFAVQSETVNMSGATPVALANTYLRVYRAYVTSSGSYANATTPSQVGTITLRVASAGATWLTLPTIDTSFGAGQSNIGAYTVPAGKTAYILSQSMSVDSTKTANLYFFQRTNADDVTTPYSGAMRVQNVYVGIAGPVSFTHRTAESYPAKTDIGWLAKVSSGTADVSVEFELLLVDN